MARRHDGFPGLALSGLQPGDQDGRPAHRAREPGRSLRQRGQGGRPLHPRALRDPDPERPHPDHPARLEVRLPEPVQGRGLLLQHPPVHRLEVGHHQSGDDARHRVRHDPPAGLRHLCHAHRRRPGLLPEHRRHARPDLDRRDHRPAPVDHPVAALRRSRRVEDRGARSRGTLRRALGRRSRRSFTGVRRLRPRALALLHREHLAARGGREGDRPAFEVGCPRRPDAPVHAVAGGGGDRHRGGEPGRPRRRRRRPRCRGRDGADDEPGDVDSVGGRGSSGGPGRGRCRSAAARGRPAVVAYRRRQDLRPLHRRGSAHDGRRRPGAPLDARLEPRRCRLGAPFELPRFRGR